MYIILIEIKKIYCLCSFLLLSFTEVREVILEVGHSQE